ncbi:mitochondrial sodium/calcium exchanger protein [Ciona intestinalis]
MKLVVFFAVFFLVTFCHSSHAEAFTQPTNASLVFGQIFGDIHDTECREYHKIKDSSLWCTFIKTTPNCQMDEGFVNYLKGAFCSFVPRLLPLISVLYALWLIFLFIGLGTTAEGFFCPSLEYIAHNLKLSQNIAGLTIVAFGNGSPDIFSAIAAFTNSNPTAAGVAVGALLGAATFVTTVVAGLVATTQTFTLAQRPFMRDMTFFIAAAFWAFYLIYTNEINIYSSVGFLGLYVFYVTIVIVGRYIHQRQREKLKKLLGDVAKIPEDSSDGINGSPSTSMDENTPLLVGASRNNNMKEDGGEWIDSKLRSGHHDEKHLHANEISVDSCCIEDDDHQSTLLIFLHGINPIPRDDWNEAKHIFKILLLCQAPWNFVCKITIPIILLNQHNNGWNRPLNSLSLLISPIFCVFATKGGSINIVGNFPLWSFMLVIGVVMSTICWLFTDNRTKPRFHWIFAYIGFIVAVVWTYTIANEIVNLLQTFGAILNVSNVIMGLTFLAWGNSIGDVVADVALARQGFPRMSLSACFGGPLFNLLIGICLPCTITIIKTGKPVQVAFTHLEAVLCAGLLTSLCLTFIVLPIRKFRMTPAYGCVLVVVYILFLTVAILAGLNVI